MDKLKVHIADLINQIPGKSEEWLMVGFTDNKELYFRGVRTEAAFIEVKVFGIQEIKHKDIFTAAICELFEEELNISKNNIYVVFTEVTDGNWGWNGELF